MDVQIYYSASVPHDESHVALIRRGRHVASFTFGSTAIEVRDKADAFIAAEEAKAAKYRKQKPAQGEVEEAI